MWPKFKTQEEVPEAFRDLYEERDGEWTVKDSIVKDPDGLKSALEKEREDRKKAEKERKELEKKIKELEEAKKAQEAGIDSEEVRKFKEQVYREVRAEVQEEIDELKKKLEAAQGEARSLRLDTKVKDLALKNGVRKDVIDDWWALNGSNFDLDDNNAPIVKDGRGKPIEKYIAEDLKKQRPYLYEGTKAGGGASNNGETRPSIPSTPTPAEDLLKNPSAALAAARMQTGS